MSGCVWVVVPASMRAGVQTDADEGNCVQVRKGMWSNVRHYLVYLASVFNMLSNVYEINPKSLGNPHDLGSAEPTTNNNKTNKMKDNTMDP